MPPVFGHLALSIINGEDFPQTGISACHPTQEAAQPMQSNTEDSVKTYFIRHSASCNMGVFLRDRFWNEGLIGIHYADKRSIEPKEYEELAARKALKVLKELTESGGYVCATIAPKSGCLIGKVAPASHITYEEAPYPDEPNRTIIMKAAKLHTFKHVSVLAANRLLIGQPQQGTLTPWSCCGNRVQRWVDEDDQAIHRVDDLLPYEQEIMCSDFLRTAAASVEKLPRLLFLSAPVGGTREAVDIAGVTADGTLLLAQVTYHDRSSRESQDKVKALKKVAEGTKASLIFFCRCETPETQDGVVYFPLQHVFGEMKGVPAWKRALGVG